MAETLILTQGANRKAIYAELLPQLEALTAHEPNAVANMSNVCSALRMALGFFWVGFYLVEGDELVLGPFQGDIACTRITKGRGVCGAAWLQAKSILVPDVELFEGHIACSSLSRSEVVVPIIKGGEIIGVIDVDSDQANDFTDVDVEGLEQVAQLVSSWL